MEMGDFMEPGQQALNQAKHRGAVSKFGVSSSWGVGLSRTGQVVSTACQEHGVFSVCSLVIILSCTFSSLLLRQPRVCVVCH